MADAPETGPAPHEQRKVVAMQLSAQRVILGGARTAAHQGEQYPTARNSIGALEDIGYVARGAERSPNGGASARKVQSMRYVRSSGSLESASSSRFQACKTFKQDYEVGASQNRQCPAGVYKPAMPSRYLEEKSFPDGPDGFDEPRGSRRCRGQKPSGICIAPQPAYIPC